METTFAIINDKVKRNAVNAVLDLPLEQYLVVIKRRGKSNEQRSYFHKLVSLIADFTGYTKEQTKWMIKEKVLGLEEWTDKKGKSHAMVKSTELLSVDDYSRLITETIIIAGKIGCEIPPSGYYGLSNV